MTPFGCLVYYLVGYYSDMIKRNLKTEMSLSSLVCNKQCVISATAKLQCLGLIGQRFDKVLTNKSVVALKKTSHYY